MEKQNIEIDGIKTEVSTDADGQITVVIPDSLRGNAEAIKEFQRKVQDNGVQVFANLYKEKHELNKTNPDVEVLRAQLAAREAELSEIKSRQHDTPSNGNGNVTGIKPVWERLGLESESQLVNKMSDDPIGYHRALMDYQTDITRAEIKNLTAQSSLELNQRIFEAKLQNEGIDVEQVKAFSRINNIPFNGAAVDYYKLKHAPKTDPVNSAILEAQAKQIKFVESGNKKVVTGVPDVKAMTDEELDAYLKS